MRIKSENIYIFNNVWYWNDIKQSINKTNESGGLFFLVTMKLLKKIKRSKELETKVSSKYFFMS